MTSNFFLNDVNNSQVRVMLRVAGDPTTSNFLSVDKKRKQLTLQEPGNNTSLTLASSSSSEKDHHQVAAEDRRVGVAAPKMFAFDGLFTTADESQVYDNCFSHHHQHPITQNIICIIRRSFQIIATTIIITRATFCLLFLCSNGVPGRCCRFGAE